MFQSIWIYSSYPETFFWKNFSQKSLYLVCFFSTDSFKSHSLPQIIFLSTQEISFRKDHLILASDFHIRFLESFENFHVIFFSFQIMRFEMESAEIIFFFRNLKGSLLNFLWAYLFNTRIKGILNNQKNLEWMLKLRSLRTLIKTKKNLIKGIHRMKLSLKLFFSIHYQSCLLLEFLNPLFS